MPASTTIRYTLEGAELSHLRKHDEVLGGIIEAQGDLDLVLRIDRFTALARAIVGQQLSVAAAKTIWGRLCALAGEPEASRIASLDPSALREIGVSNAKARYVLGLAAGVLDGTVDLACLDDFDDEGAIDYLMQLNGVGRWTAEMFLIFSLGREDVFAVDDAGLRRAMRSLYSIDGPGDDYALISAPWKPYRSIASLCLWRALDNGKLG